MRHPLQNAHVKPLELPKKQLAQKKGSKFQNSYITSAAWTLLNSKNRGSALTHEQTSE